MTVPNCFVRIAALWITTLSLTVSVAAQALTEAPLHEAAGTPNDAAVTHAAAPALTHEDLDATLWMQTSSEYRSACLQTYRAATRQLELALVRADWTAALEQQGGANGNACSYYQLPPAVILDVDETVLDNSAFQAHLIENGQEYDPAEWDAWISCHISPAIPGVKDFVAACRSAGVTVFYVTNRRTQTQEATKDNLLQIGLLTDASAKTLLCKGDQPTWTSDKSTRRAHIAQAHRILLIIGDDLNDFLSVGIKPTPAARLALADEHADKWGDKWFVLPNANYGGWERAVYDWQDGSSRATKLKKKRAALRSR